MGELLKRRAMMAQASGAGPSPVECPYVTDGLIFWLDGINQGSGAATWTDLVGGKIFELDGCTKNADGVYFDGSTSYARTPGVLSSDYASETLELAFLAENTNFCLVCPVKSAPVGIGFITNTAGNYVMTRIDGVRAADCRYFTGVLSGENRISISNALCVQNGKEQSRSGSDSWGGNSTEYSYIGARMISTISKRFKGTLYSVRIYNRHLTPEEILANQTVDMQRFHMETEVN